MFGKVMPIRIFMVVLGIVAGTSGFTAGPAFGVPPGGEKPNSFGSWDKIFEAADRFELVMNDAAVLDKETGLVWEQSPSIDHVDWNSALIACANKTVGGRKGWRLPAFYELASLLDPAVPGFGPLLPEGHPFTNVLTTSAYFSATTLAIAPDTHAWGVSFFGTINVGHSSKTPGLLGLAWCVRGGSPGPTEY